jgi:O-antigen/teichoic acid export membrane protein
MSSGTVASSSELEPRSSTRPEPVHSHGPEAARIISTAYQSAGLKGLDLSLDPTPESERNAPAPAPDAAPARPAEDPPRVARNLSVLAGGQLVTWTMTLVWTLIVPRALGPVGLGLVVSAQSVSGILGIVLGLGTRQYLVREIVLLPHHGSKLVGTALVLRIMLAPLVGIAAILWAYFAHYSHDAAVVLYLITAMTIFTLLSEPMQAGFQAIERMKYLALADVINKSAQSVIGIALVIIGLRAVGIAASMATIAGCVVILNIIWLRRFLSIDVKTSGQRLASMTKESFTFWAFGLFAFVYFWIDTIMLSLMTPPHVVGWYGSTTQILQTLMFLPVLVSTAWLPRLVNAAAEGHRQLVTLARTPVDCVLVISVPIAAGIALIARPLIHVVYGPQFAHAAPVLMLLACCIPPLYLNIMLAQVLLAEKRQAVWTIVMAGAAVVNPLFNLVLIPYTQHHFHNGALGAAISLILTEVLMDAVGFVLVGRHVFTRNSVRRTVMAILASAGMWGAAYAAEPLGTALSLLAGGLVLVALVVVLRILTPEEIALLRNGLARLRARRAQVRPEPQPSSG